METNVREIMLIGIAGLGIGGGILTNYLIKRNRPAEYYLAQKAEAEASVEKYRLDLEFEAKESEQKRVYAERETERKRTYDLNYKKLCNEREAALPDSYWMYKAAIENKEARKYEADKLNSLITALGDTSNLTSYDDLATGLYILAKRTERDEKIIEELIDLVKKIEIAGKTDDATLQLELTKKIDELNAKDNLEEELQKLESLKHIDPSKDFNFDALMHKENV